MKWVQKLQNWSIWPKFRLLGSFIHQQVILEGPESLKSPHKLVLPENVSKSAFYTIILGEMGPKVARLVNLAQILTCRPLIKPLMHKGLMLEGPESLKRPHKIVLPENVSTSAFYTVILGEMGPKV